MDEIVIAFDVDGTILNNEGIPPDVPIHLRPKHGVNLEVILLIQILSKKMKNTKVIVWSGGGQEYAQRVCREYGLDKYVHGAYGKPSAGMNIMKTGEYNDPVDICFDDIHACKLAGKNLIVKMK